MLVPRNESKYKVLTISDHPLVSSGVGIQTRYMIEGLLRSGKFQFLSLGGAIKHQDYRPQKLNDFGDDWVVLPIDGYGDENLIREILDEEKPDAIWFMTDPRFFQWLFHMSDEIRDRNIPLLYNHVWDEFPVPKFNRLAYHSCDFIGCISKLTYDIVKHCDHPDFDYIPHAVNYDVFKVHPEKDVLKYKKDRLKNNSDKFVFFYNSRNARRKMTSDVVRFFKEFLDKVGQDKAFLLMQTDPNDPEGANLIEVARMLNLTPEQIAFSPGRVSDEELIMMYNMADVTICLSNNEGFGLSSLESLACGTPVISVKTGGLQDQNVDPETGEVFGVSLHPDAKSLTGSQQIPYIFDCRAADDNILAAYLTMFNMTKEERNSIGLDARESILKRFPMNGPNGMITKWQNALDRKIKEFKDSGYSDRIKFVEV